MPHIQLHNVNTTNIIFYLFEMTIKLSKKSMIILYILDRTYLRDTDQEKTNTFLPLDVSE